MVFIGQYIRTVTSQNQSSVPPSFRDAIDGKMISFLWQRPEYIEFFMDIGSIVESYDIKDDMSPEDKTIFSSNMQEVSFGSDRRFIVPEDFRVTLDEYCLSEGATKVPAIFIGRPDTPQHFILQHPRYNALLAGAYGVLMQSYFIEAKKEDRMREGVDRNNLLSQQTIDAVLAEDLGVKELRGKFGLKLNIPAEEVASYLRSKDYLDDDAINMKGKLAGGILANGSIPKFPTVFAEYQRQVTESNKAYGNTN